MLHDRTPLREQHRGEWREILIGLGVPGKALVNRHGPCPACGGKDRFRFDDKDGHGTFICNHCGAGDGPKLAMLVTGLDFKALADKLNGGSVLCSDASTVVRTSDIRHKPTNVHSSDNEPSEAKRNRMNALWGKARPIGRADPAGIYLTSRLRSFPEHTGLRFLPHCPYPEGETWPAMLALFVDASGKPSGLHRTYLTNDGRKAPVVSAKLSLGPLRDGGAVRLTPTCGDTLGIAEGIETALAASIMFSVPCWAALNANRLAAWVPPNDVRKVIIFADNDDNFTGQTAAFDLAARLEGNSLTAHIETPIETDRDWADMLEAERLGRRKG